MTTRPNILFLIADDHRASAIGAYGDPTVQTPVLDQLCAQGTSFRQNHQMGGLSGAVCIPTRACVHTGAHVFRASAGKDQRQHEGIKTIAPGHTFLAEQFRQQGYRTFATGKWHNDAASFARSFADAENVFFGGMSDHDAVPVQDFDPSGEYPPERSELADGFSTDIFGDTTIRFLDGQRADDGPFFLYCAFTAPHDPRTPPADWADAYAPEAMPLPANFRSQHPFDNGELRNRDENLAGFPRTAEEIRQHTADYYGMISHMDAKIGQMLAALERNGLAENTIVVYTADHGLAVGQHGLLGKQNLYDHSVRVPLIVRGPGVPQNLAVDALTHTFDIYPTLCELAGLSVPAGLDALALPLHPGDASRETVHSVYKDVQRMARDDEWKLIRYYQSADGPGSSAIQLFHLPRDPWELDNRADDPAAQGARQRLEAELARWMEAVEDPLLLN